MYDRALNVTRRIASVYATGPGGQSHQVFGTGNHHMFAAPAKVRDGQQNWFALSGAVVAAHVISGLFGVRPAIGGGTAAADLLRDLDVDRGFDGMLSHVPIRGKLYTVT
eukprot:SAG31_NODE_12056_length_973_cov_0.869565_3_plen_108_part_01